MKPQNRRRRLDAAAIPPRWSAWFGGAGPRPLAVLAVPFCALLPERWAAFVAANPQATPPAGYEWLSAPTDRWHMRYSEHQVALARRAAQTTPGW